MIQIVFSGTIALIMAKFVLNDIPHAAGVVSPYKSYLVFYPISYFYQEGYRVPANTITEGGMDFAQTSRLVTSNIGFEDAAVKFIESIRNPLDGWRNVKFDRFLLERRWYSERDIKVFLTDEVIEKYMQTMPKNITPEFFSRRRLE